LWGSIRGAATSDMRPNNPALAARAPVRALRATELSEVESLVQELRDDRDRLDRQCRELRERLDEATARAQRDEALILEQHREFQILSDTLRKVFQSRTWRLGAPLRAVMNQLRWMLGVGDASLNGAGAPRPLAGVVSKSALLLSGCPGGAKRYRCDHLAEQLESLGVSTEVAVQGEIDLAQAVDCFTLFVLHRVAYDRNVDWFLRKARERGRVVLFDTDDWVFDSEAFRYIAALQEMASRDRSLYRQGLVRYRETIARCDGLLVSTQTLADLAIGLHKEVRVLPNVVSREMVELAIAARAGTSFRRTADPYQGRVTLGYFSGTPTHNRDFAQAEEAIEWAMDTYSNVHLLTVGHIDVSARFGRFGERFQHLPLMPWQRLAEPMVRVDVNLAPLEPDNPFTASKSCIKFLEAAIVGVPTIASPMPDYRRTIRHGANGFLAELPDEWRDSLRALIESPDLRASMGAAARDDVLREHTTRAHAVRAMETVRELCPALPEERYLTINWILRAPIAGTGGGYWTIFRLANHLGASGHRVRVYVEPIAHLEGKSREEIVAFLEENFGPLRVQPIVGHERILPADVTIATNWPTAYTAANEPDALFRFYFIQDFEPEFYSDRDPLYREAERTYELPLQHVCIGRSLGARISRLTGRETECIDFAVDTEVFRTRVRAADRPHPVRVLFFARPGLKRRGFELGIEALERLSRERPEVQILLFGARDEELRGLKFPYVNLGVLGHYELARAMNEAHILLCFSLSANVSWVPLQAMACGCAVVEADVPGVREMVEDGETCLLAEPNPQPVAEALLRLVDDGALRCRLAENAAATLAERSWESSARQFEQILVQRSFLRTKSAASESRAAATESGGAEGVGPESGGTRARAATASGA